MTNRTCKVCGKRYYFCSSPNCDRSKGKPMWMVMFDCENCKDIWMALSDRFWKKISDEEAVARLLALDLSEIDSFPKQIREEVEELLASPAARKAMSPSHIEEEPAPHVEEAPSTEDGFVEEKKPKRSKKKTD